MVSRKSTPPPCRCRSRRVIEDPDPRVFGTTAPGTVIILATDESGAYNRTRLYKVGTKYLYATSSEDGPFREYIPKKEAIDILKHWYGAQVRGDRHNMSDEYDGRYNYVFEPEAFPLIAAAYGVPVSEVENGSFIPTQAQLSARR